MPSNESSPLRVKTPQEGQKARVEAYAAQIALNEKTLKEAEAYTADCEERAMQLRAALEQFREDMREKKLDALAREAVQEQIHAIENETARLDMLVQEQRITISELKEHQRTLAMDKQLLKEAGASQTY
ncbi:MAG: hypothetical protein KGH79_02400 [Patescibacteria group bacterium]|nr:hypothetical protein [Patescibacteria group bacterium]